MAALFDRKGIASLTTPPSTTLPRGAFAVLANSNARGLNEASLGRLRALVGADDLYCSHTIHQSEFLVRRMLARNYRAIFACGGDGTITHLVNLLHQIAPEGPWPMIGILRLGTGNGLADSLGYGTLEDTLLPLLTRGKVTVSALPMISCEGELFPFGGCGYDAAVLGDYVRLKNRVAETPLAKALTGLPGYLLAGCLKTAPKLLFARPANVRVFNTGAEAFAVRRDGRALATFERDALLYDGPAAMVGAGVVPVIGNRLRMFPCARTREGFFQLRVACMSSAQALRHLPKIWRGDVTAREGAFDFHVERVRIEFDRPVPFQIGGDVRGDRDQLELSLSPSRFEFVRPC